MNKMIVQFVFSTIIVTSISGAFISSKSELLMEKLNRIGLKYNRSILDDPEFYMYLANDKLVDVQKIIDATIVNMEHQIADGNFTGTIPNYCFEYGKANVLLASENLRQDIETCVQEKYQLYEKKQAAIGNEISEIKKFIALNEGICIGNQNFKTTMIIQCIDEQFDHIQELVEGLNKQVEDLLKENAKFGSPDAYCEPFFRHFFHGSLDDAKIGVEACIKNNQ